MGIAHRLALVGTPVVALATMALGLRVGAHTVVHAAIVNAAPRAHGSTAFAWQIVTLVDDRGVRETERHGKITVVARGNGKEATWSGETNADGIAEASLDLSGVERGDRVDLEVRAEGLAEPLATGRIAWDDAAWMNGAPGPFVRAAKRDGAIALDVAVLGGRLAPRVPSSILVRATSREDGHAIVGATILAEPETGIDVAPPSATTCAIGWARFNASPAMFVAALSLHARMPDGRVGDWAGSLPVAPGAMAVALGDVVKGGEPLTIEVTAPSERPGYFEVDDDTGRAAAVATELAHRPDGAAGVTLELPALSPGLKWLVASSEPRGAETFEGATRALPFFVAGTPPPQGAPSASDVCGVAAYLALHPAGTLHRWVALDGFAGRAGAIAARRRRGLAIALGSLAVAALLELILLMGAARRGRAIARSRDVEEGAALVKRSGAGTVLVGILAALLGFGLLAALLLARA